MLMGVSERQVYRDRAKLRKRYQQAMSDLNVIGELYSIETLGRIKSTIRELAFNIEYTLKPAAQGVSYLDASLIAAAIYDPNQRR